MGIIENWRKEINQLLTANDTHVERIAKIMQKSLEINKIDCPENLLIFASKMDELSEALMNMSLDYARMGQHAKDLYNTLGVDDF